MKLLIRCICCIKHLKLATSRPTDGAARYLEIAVIVCSAAVKVAVETAPNDISAFQPYQVLKYCRIISGSEYPGAAIEGDKGKKQATYFVAW